jgi:hypothetical protein
MTCARENIHMDRLRSESLKLPTDEDASESDSTPINGLPRPLIEATNVDNDGAGGSGVTPKFSKCTNVRWDFTTSDTGVKDSVATTIHKERRGYHRCIPMMAPLIIPPHQGPNLGSTSVLTSAVPLLEASCKLGGCSIASTWPHARSERLQWHHW